VLVAKLISKALLIFYKVVFEKDLSTIDAFHLGIESEVS